MMLRKLIALKRPCATFVLQWINSVNKQARSLHCFNLQSLPRSSSNENQFLSVLQHRKEQEMQISSCGLKLSRLEFANIRYHSLKLLEFRDKVRMSDDYAMSMSEWENIVNEIVTETPDITTSLDGSIMKILKNKPDMSASFMRFVKSKRQPDFICLTHFIHNCAEKYEDFVLDEYENLLKSDDAKKIRFKGNLFVKGLSKTRLWRQSLELLDLELTSNQEHLPGEAVDACSEVLKRTLKQKEYELFFQIWDQFARNKGTGSLRTISDMFYETWKEGVVPIDLLLDLLKLEELPLTDIQAHDIQNFISREWGAVADANVSEMHGRTECRVCKSKLDQEVIEDSIFQEMGKVINDKILVGRNVFKKTKPVELRRFYEFIRNQERRFDYIIDELNVILGSKPGNDDLTKIIRRLNQQGKNVLVVTKGRHLIGPTKRRHPNNHKGQTTTFVVDNVSYDDCYMLIAAFSSGPHCYVVTNDDFKDHIALADAHLIPYFWRWRKSRRVMHKRGKLLYPDEFSWKAQESNRTWHIPFEKPVEYTDAVSALVAKFQALRFLCIRKLDYTPSVELTTFRKTKHSYLKDINS